MGDVPKLSDMLLDVGDTLSLDDKIALVFLLSSLPETGLHVLRSLTAGESREEENGLFRQFLLQLMVPDSLKLSDAFVEALATVQNYRAGRLLGHSKSAMLSPRFTGHVNQVKKHLYTLADSLTEKQTCDLISQVNSSEKKKCRHLEEALLDWQLKGIVNVETDLDSSSLETINKYLTNCHEGAEADNESSATSSLSNSVGDDFYPIIDPSEVGYCVVINNDVFTENKELVQLMPEDKLPPRPGSERDVLSVQQVFNNLRFRVCIHRNVNYAELRELLEFYASSVSQNHSCIVLVVMSHGTEDIIYAADSVPIRVEALEMAFQRNSCPQLTGKPKMLVIQACQGSELQRVMLDSGSKPASVDAWAVGPERGDALIAWSTVKGYASFRDRAEGSWYIQELCRELKQHSGSKDLVEILTRVNNHLRNKTFCGMFMVPSLTISLCKRFKLIY